MTTAALDPDRLLADAREQTGLDDLGDDSYREGLDRFAQSLREEGRLSGIGVQVAIGDIMGYLTNRLRLTEWHRQHPEVGKADVTPPIFIVGQGRTGTTILHDLLAQDPANRVPLTWEVDHPIPPPETATYDTDPRIAQVQAQLDMVELVIPGFKAMHPMGPQFAQECVRITAGDFRSMILPTQYFIPSYAKWLIEDADMAPAYRWHRRFLQVLQSRHHGERWVLKSPGHLWCLGALRKEYPNALLVQTHRDPLRIIASLGSLLATLRKLGSDDIGLEEGAAEFAGYLETGFDRAVDVRQNGTVPADRVVDVQFREFMSDPFKTIRGIYEPLGLELSREAETRMRAFLEAHPQDLHGKHHYTFAETGLDIGEWRERTRRYREYFDVPAENV